MVYPVRADSADSGNDFLQLKAGEAVMFLTKSLPVLAKKGKSMKVRARQGVREERGEGRQPSR